MSWFPQSKDHLPLTWWNRVPIYLAAILALAGLVSMVVTSIATAVDQTFSEKMVFTYPGLMLEHRFWTPFTYIFFNPPSIWLVIGTFLLWRFGEEVEKHLGRRAFVKLVLLLLAVPPLVILLLGLLNGPFWFVYGVDGLELGVFLAFVVLYPRAQLSIIIAVIPAWVIAAVIVGVRFLEYLSHQQWGGIMVLAAIVLTSFAFITFEQGRWSVGSLRLKFPRKKKARLTRPPTELTVLPPYREDREETAKGGRTETATVDSILEKISKQGMQSLTAEERRILEKASEQLKRKG